MITKQYSIQVKDIINIYNLYYSIGYIKNIFIEKSINIKLIKLFTYNKYISCNVNNIKILYN